MIEADRIRRTIREGWDAFYLDFYLKSKARIRARSVKQSHPGNINLKTAKCPRLIVCDDIDKEENMGKQSISKRRMEKISQELAGALAPEGGGHII